MAIQRAVTLRSTALVLALLAAAAQAQPQPPQAAAPTASIFFKPGDTVRIRVSFDKPITVENGGTYVQFALDGEPIPPQREMLRYWNFNGIAAASPTEYDFSGVVPEAIASGEYKLRFIVIQSQGASKTYNSDSFPNQLRIAVHNEKTIRFPDIEHLRVVTEGGTKLSGGATVSGSVVIR